jgi:peptidoglycan L-alanyl-D-glutamate endopeptidase CwlK
MSAGVPAAFDFHLAKRTGDMTLLAPAFRAAVEHSIAECIAKGLDAIVYETYRSNELQALYYTRGRTVRPPSQPVTNAMSNLYSWHGYGLAVDVIHRKKEWDAGDAWFEQVAVVFERNGCKWGGHWRSRDLPHFQWGLCKPSPSERAREILRTQGVHAVWEAVGALGGAPLAASPAPPASATSSTG